MKLHRLLSEIEKTIFNAFNIVIDLLLENVVQKVQNLLKMFHTQFDVKENTRYLIQIISRVIIVSCYISRKMREVEHNFLRMSSFYFIYLSFFLMLMLLMILSTLSKFYL